MCTISQESYEIGTKYIIISHRDMVLLRVTFVLVERLCCVRFHETFPLLWSRSCPPQRLWKIERSWCWNQPEALHALVFKLFVADQQLCLFEAHAIRHRHHASFVVGEVCNNLQNPNFADKLDRNECVDMTRLQSLQTSFGQEARIAHTRRHMLDVIWQIRFIH